MPTFDNTLTTTENRARARAYNMQLEVLPSPLCTINRGKHVHRDQESGCHTVHGIAESPLREPKATSVVCNIISHRRSFLQACPCPQTQSVYGKPKALCPAPINTLRSSQDSRMHPFPQNTPADDHEFREACSCWHLTLAVCTQSSSQAAIACIITILWEARALWQHKNHMLIVACVWCAALRLSRGHAARIVCAIAMLPCGHKGVQR
jgi:hypothetical protein